MLLKPVSSRSDAGEQPQNEAINTQSPIVYRTYTYRYGQVCVPPEALIFPPVPAAGWPADSISDSLYGPRYIVHISKRLYPKVDPNGPEMRPGLGRCWQWTGSITGKGNKARGNIWWRTRYPDGPQYVHRVAWELWFGPIPEDRQINHHCDNGLCVRLDHLYLGTQSENLKDASVRGRLHIPKASSQLTLADRLVILRTPFYRGVGRDLAQRYGVTHVCISKIRKGRFVGAPVDHVPQDERVQTQHGSRALDVCERLSESVGV